MSRYVKAQIASKKVVNKPGYLSWDYFHGRINEIPEISEQLKADGEEGLAFLEKELAAGFFKTCGNNHPVYHKLIMAGGGVQLNELVKWINVLQRLKRSDSNYQRLLQKLHSKTEATIEAIPFIDISTRQLDQGFSINFPEEKQNQKNSALELTFTRMEEKGFVEVSRFSEGDERAKQDKLYYGLLDLCFKYGFWFPVAGKLYKLVPDEDLPGLQ